jgi:hypothetical protein
VKINQRAVDERVSDDIGSEIEQAIDRSLSSAAKERMAWEDVMAIRQVLIEEVVAPYVLEVANSPHEVVLASLSTERF